MIRLAQQHVAGMVTGTRSREMNCKWCEVSNVKIYAAPRPHKPHQTAPPKGDQSKPQQWLNTICDCSFSLKKVEVPKFYPSEHGMLSSCWAASLLKIPRQSIYPPGVSSYDKDNLAPKIKGKKVNTFNCSVKQNWDGIEEPNSPPNFPCRIANLSI